ncbi:MAG: sigma 54-interacting transcriptional regulator [Lewinellaceae bacterium]|nr:sigma 54-interacting transcriptional regulator [Lewinellaceae bacterium]
METKALINLYLESTELIHSSAVWFQSDGRIIGANTQFLNQLGYQREELLQKTIFQINPHLNMLGWRKIWEELESTGKSALNSEHITRNGRMYPVQMQALLVHAGDEKVCICTVKNLMERSRYRDMLDLIGQITGVGGWKWNLLTDELIVTTEVYHLLELEPSAFIYPAREALEHLEKRLQPVDYHLLLELSKQAIREEKRAQCRINLAMNDGTTKKLLLDIYPVFQEGRCTQLIGAVREVDLDTDEAVAPNPRPKKSDVELMRFLEFSLDQSSDIILWVKPNGTFLNFNETACRQLGYPREELAEMHLLDLFPYSNQETIDAAWETLRVDKQFTGDQVITRKDGSSFPVEITVNYASLHGLECTCSIIRDISLRKKEQENLQNAFEEISRLKKDLEMENTYLQTELNEQFNFNNIITNSPEYKKILLQIEQVAPTDAIVLITGETGTGKELVARAIHHNSRRSSKQMIKVNCAALPENLIESELFGHEKGAFTGAIQRKMGRFELAHKGSLFLDEISELPLELQSKLLRVLQEGEFERVGGMETIKTDVRIIAATNRNLEKMVEEGRFREDLFYRINVFPIHNMALRDRPDDIPLLLRHFVQLFSNKMGKQIDQIPVRVFEVLQQYHFPGNIRELENIIERAVILSNGNRLQIDLGAFRKKAAGHAKEGFLSLEAMQRKYILDVLEQTHWRVSGPEGAARILQVKDKTLFSKMQKLGIVKKG